MFNIGEITGSGLLDITKLVNNRNNTQVFNSNDLLNNKFTFSIYLNNPTYTETTINIAAYWFEKIENNTSRLSNYDLSLNVNGVVATSNSLYNNYELIKLTTTYHGQISLTLELKEFAGTNEDLIGIAWAFN